ncbi:MAG: hypothetical protein ACI89X_003481, partial [Planctomycetota bacterium]
WAAPLPTGPLDAGLIFGNLHSVYSSLVRLAPRPDWLTAVPEN